MIDKSSSSFNNFVLNNCKYESKIENRNENKNMLTSDDVNTNANHVILQSSNYSEEPEIKKRKSSKRDKDKYSSTVISLIDSSDSDDNIKNKHNNDNNNYNNNDIYKDNDNNYDINDNNDINGCNKNNIDDSNIDNYIENKNKNNNSDEDICPIDSDNESNEFDLINSSQSFSKRKKKLSSVVSQSCTSFSSFKSFFSFPNSISIPTATDCRSQSIKNGNREVVSKEVEKEVEFEYRIILLEDPPHLLQRMYGTDNHFNNSSKGVSTGSGNSWYVLL